MITKSETPTARKRHRCSQCTGWVEPGSRYVRFTTIGGDDPVASDAFCLDCNDLAAALYKAGIYGEDEWGGECYPWLSDVYPNEVPAELQSEWAKFRDRIERGE